jgi:divalent metal cation (Fe/Co/Zn/Cd) transporter
MTDVETTQKGRAHHLRGALRLAYFTISWNVLEGIVAVVASGASGSRALLGFGLDSFVESLSAGVLAWRLAAERSDPHRAEAVEVKAARAIGVTFLLLAAYVAFEAVRSLWAASPPEASVPGIVLTIVSLVVMPLLLVRKRHYASALGSSAAKADSVQTSACIYLSIVVLAGLVLNAAFSWWWADPVAALIVVGFLVREGVETLRAKAIDDCC